MFLPAQFTNSCHSRTPFSDKTSAMLPYGIDKSQEDLRARTISSGYVCGSELISFDEQVSPSVLRVTRLIVLFAGGPFFAVAGHRNGIVDSEI